MSNPNAPIAQLTHVHGHADAGFEPVVRAFAANFAERGDLGAALAVVHDGRLAVDLWGGVADAATGRPWQCDTLQVIFSGTKGLVAVCMLMLIERGALALDEPVATRWPEFAAAGKADVRVRDLVAHTARMPGVRARLAEADLLVPQRIAELLAAQPQEDDPRAAFAYHPLTYGWLCGELVRRADVGGRSIGRFFAEEVAAPLGLDIWIGLPPQHEARVSTLRYEDRWVVESALAEATVDPDDALHRSVNQNPPLFPAETMSWNRPDFHAAEIAGGGGIATARSMARLYGCLARGGEIDGVRILDPATVALGRTELSRGIDLLSGNPLAFGVGFQLQTARLRYGPPADAFGHDGAGGSVHGAWPAQRVGFSYAMNELRWRPEADDPRVDPVLAALHEAVGG
ncbi:MAG TPA: serine hydrolase domain-containing protein [Conexibacter sp.]|nr:serine hydrolase domain-containing protein [Conexibacter sp.]